MLETLSQWTLYHSHFTTWNACRYRWWVSDTVHPEHMCALCIAHIHCCTQASMPSGNRQSSLSVVIVKVTRTQHSIKVATTPFLLSSVPLLHLPSTAHYLQPWTTTTAVHSAHNAFSYYCILLLPPPPAWKCATFGRLLAKRGFNARFESASAAWEETPQHSCSLLAFG